MPGFGPVASGPVASVANWADYFRITPALSISALVTPDQRLIVAERATAEGTLIKSTSLIWSEIARALGADWSRASDLGAEQWEEMVAGAFHNAGYEVTLTPRSGDHGRDLIALRHGTGCLKIIGSVKAYGVGNLVPYDAIRSLLGVMSGDHSVSKGIITTTSDFPPRVAEDPYISPFLPTRLELMNGKKLQQWLNELSRENPGPIR